jgi:hypothetical protein
MIFLKNPKTNEITSFQNESQIGIGFIDWIKLTQQEIDLHLLNQAKQNKIQELKTIRDEKNIEPLTSCIAKILNENGTLGNDTSFLFYANRHPSNPASDPNAILTACIMFGQTIPYSTRDLKDNKICIALTPTIAKIISVSLVKRNGDNYKQYDNLTILINQAKTKEEINNINWN